MHDKKGRDFDLYAIDVDGSNLERITFFEGFDGIPHVQLRWQVPCVCIQ